MNRIQTRATYRAEAGYTLTEVIVAVAIFAVIFISALLIYDQSNKVFKQGVEASDNQQNTRVAFDKVMTDIRMTGFDYDRDGIPSGSIGGTNIYQQPDEQIEYVGRTAITIRANFDYDSDIDNDGDGNPDYGREASLESTQFPVVTTGNDEIVTYALVSTNSSANTGQIKFFADVPNRNAYPGGDAETEVTITGVDLTNNNPPYTLQRITLNDSGGLVRTPLADNIRSMRFTYFEDATGTTPLTAIDGVTALNQDAIATDVGGKGQYDPANPGALLNERKIRSKIRSVHVELVGMNESIDAGYTDPLETLTTNNIQHYRKMRLEATIAPRNFGKRGMREQSARPPGNPTITKLCFGHCGTAYLEWTAPPESGVYGAAEQYAILYDTDNVGGFAYFQYQQNQTSGYVTGLDPGTTYYFAVQAINSYGSAASSSPYPSGQPLNRTTPNSPTNVAATNSDDATAVASQIVVTWTLPTANDPSHNTLSCAPSGTPTANWQPGEIVGYRIWRDTEEDFVPSGSNLIHDWTSAADITFDYAGGTGRFNDTTAASCKEYYYRIQGVEACQATVAYNAGGAVGLTNVVPAVASNAIKGDALPTGIAPQAPLSLLVDAASSCDGVTNLCSVMLEWPKVARNVNGDLVYIDNYRVNRERTKDPNDPSSYAAWPIDPNDPNAPVVTNGTSQGATITYTDATAEQIDLGDGLTWHYRYSIQAVDCGTAGAASTTAIFPQPCSFSGSVVIQTGASGGSGTAADPWIMESGDGFQVDPPPSDTLDIVTFTVYDPTGSAVATHTENFDPFQYSWPGLTAGELYRIVLTITNNAGCTEQLVRYVYEQSIAPCVLSPSSQVAGPTAFPTTGSSPDVYTYGVALANTGSENLTPIQIKLDWTDRPAQTSSQDDAILARITYNGISNDTTPPANPPTTGLRATPNGTPVIRPGVPYTVQFQFEARRQRTDNTLTNPIDKLCIVYQIPSEPNTNKYCNVMGIGSPTNNPTSCD